MKVDTNMILILGLGAAAVFFFMKSGGFDNLNDNDQAVAQQIMMQQQMNQAQQAAFLKAMSEMKAGMGAGKDDNPWDDVETYQAIVQMGAQVVGAVGSFF